MRIQGATTCRAPLGAEPSCSRSHGCHGQCHQCWGTDDMLWGILLPCLRHLQCHPSEARLFPLHSACHDSISAPECCWWCRGAQGQALLWPLDEGFDGRAVGLGSLKL